MTLYRVRTSWTGGGGGSYLTTMFFEETGGTAAQANAAVAAFWTAVKPYVSSSLTYTTDASVYLIDEATGEPTGVNAVTPATAPGTASGDVLPWATQGVVQWRTGFFIGGREVRGRTFLPGATEAYNTSSRPSSAMTTAVNVAAAALIADANSTFGVYSLKNFSFQEATVGAQWSDWGVLRSRRD